MTLDPMADMPSSPTPPPMPPARSMGRTFFLGVGSTLLIVLLVVAGAVVRSIRQASDQPIIVKVADTLGVAVATVNAKEIPYGDYIQEKTTLRTFYEQNPTVVAQLGPTAMNETTISDQVLSRLVINSLIQDVAVANNIMVSDTEVDDAKKELLTPFPNEAEAEKQLQESYGWTLATYIDRVVRPTLVQQKLQKLIEESTDEKWKAYAVDQVEARHILFVTKDITDDKVKAAVKTQAETALNRLKKGADFDTVGAELVAKDKNAKPGENSIISENLGWFGSGVMVPEFEQAAFALETGKMSQALVETPYGYHIIMVDGKRSSRSFDKFMQEQITSAKISVHLGVHNPFAPVTVNTTTGTSTPQGDDLTGGE